MGKYSGSGEDESADRWWEVLASNAGLAYLNNCRLRSALGDICGR
jgi:hypothetical protein